MIFEKIKSILYIIVFVFLPLIIMTAIVYWLSPNTFYEKLISLVFWCVGIFIGYLIEIGVSK